MPGFGLQAKKAILIGLFAAVLAAGGNAVAKDRDHGEHRGNAYLVPRATLFYSPFYTPYYWGADPFWDPWYDSFYSDRYIPPVPDQGKVKLHDPGKQDQVFVNGSFAGTAGDLKTIKLAPGNYTIEVKRAGRSVLRQNVYVLSGKTVDLSVG